MKTIYLISCLLIGSLFSSCAFNKVDEMIEQETALFIQDVKFRMNKEEGKLNINFIVSPLQRSTSNSIPVTVNILDANLKETGIFVKTDLNKTKKTLPIGISYQESILTEVPQSILSRGGVLYFNITINKITFPTVRYVYTEINVPDWDDGPVLGV